MKLDELMTFREFAEKYQRLFPMNTLRFWRSSNYRGFRDTVSVKCGRRVLLDVAAFEKWIEQTRRPGRPGAGERR